MGLSADVQDGELRKVFQAYGDIKDVYIKPKDNFAFAFISYYEMEQANRAVAEAPRQSIAGRRIKCDLARPRNASANRGGPGGSRPNNGGSRACFKCNQEGHFARECPNAEASDNRRGNSYNSGGGNSYNRNDSRGDYSNNRGDYNSNRGDNNRGGNNSYNSRGNSSYGGNNSYNNSASKGKSNSRSASPAR